MCCNSYFYFLVQYIFSHLSITNSKINTMKYSNKKSAHTPGDWFVDGIEIRSKSRKEYIGKIFSGGLSDISEQEGLANQKLVSAAPDMLFALQKTMDYLKSQTSLTDPEIDMYEAVEFALSKADAINDITIDANLGPVDMFLNTEIKVGSMVLIENDGGHFSSHGGRTIINGIEPHHYSKHGHINVEGKIMKVLSFEKLIPGGENKEKEMIVLTDGKYSYWFGYYTDIYKSWIKLA